MTKIPIPTKLHHAAASLRSRSVLVAAICLLLIGSVFASFPTKITHAESLGYPWPTDAEAPCQFGATGGASCVNPNDSASKYNWGVYVGGVFHPYRNGYQYRNCTDYAQWKIGTMGGSVPAGLGNAGDWYNNSPANKRSATPQAGFAAIRPTSPSDTFGHVAVVESVNAGGTITVSEYNRDGQGHGGRRTGTPASLGFSQFVNFGATTPPPTQVSGPTTIGSFDPSSGWFYLRNSNTPGAADVSFNYGNAGWVPLAGDWDGNGTVTAGSYDPSTSTFYLRNSNTSGPADTTVQYGNIGWKPIVGDWDGQ